MYQFFVKNEQIQGDTALILGKDVNHIKNVLRMKAGERIRVSNEEGIDYYCDIAEITSDCVKADIQFLNLQGSELPAKIYLFQGLPKGDKMEWIIQKAVELGVHEIVPVAMKNCVVKLDAKKAQAKVKRWQAISESAAKQSKRSVIPNVHEVMTFSEAVEYAMQCESCLLPYENAKGMKATQEAVSAAAQAGSIAIFIGPEGGFDRAEIEKVDGKMEQISLGKRILRTETAGMTILSILMYQIELQQEKKN